MIKKKNPFQFTNQSLFLNLITNHQGVLEITTPLNRLENCLIDCHIFGLDNERQCDQYCYEITDQFQTSILFANDQCPLHDPVCCKTYARDNDFAYLFCIRQSSYQKMNQ